MASIRKISETSYKVTVSRGRKQADTPLYDVDAGQAHDGEADGKGRAESGV